MWNVFYFYKFGNIPCKRSRNIEGMHNIAMEYSRNVIQPFQTNEKAPDCIGVLLNVPTSYAKYHFNTNLPHFPKIFLVYSLHIPQPVFWMCRVIHSES